MPIALRAVIVFLFARKEIMILMAMLIAIPVTLYLRSKDRYERQQGVAHQKLADKLLSIGPDLVVFQLDPEYTKLYEDQLTNCNVLCSYKNYTNVGGWRTPTGAETDILDVRLGASNYPSPNLVLRTKTKDGFIFHRFFYAFQGQQSLHKANQFLMGVADSKLDAIDHVLNPTTEVVGYSWKTQFIGNGPVVSARMWWGEKYNADTCATIDGNERYIVLQSTNDNYEQRLIPNGIKINEKR